MSDSNPPARECSGEPIAGALLRSGLLAAVVTASGCNISTRAPSQFRVLVSPGTVDLQRLDSARVTAAVVDLSNDTVARALTFQPRDPILISANNQGTIRSLGGIGSTVVVVVDPADNNASDSVFVTVSTTVERIGLAPADTAIGASGRVAFRVAASDSHGSVTGIPFTLSFSPDSGYLVDSADGVVRATGHRGEVVVTIHSGSATASAGVSVIDTLTAGRLPAPGHPRWVSVSRTGRAFVNRGSAQFVSQYDAATRAPGASLVVPFGISALAVDSAASRLYVGTSTLVLDIDLSTGVAVDTQFTGAQPLGLAVGPDGTTVWVSVVGDVLQIYDRTSGGLVKSLTAATMTRFASPSSRDSLLYGMTAGAVMEINTRTASLSRTFGGGGSLTDLAVSADGSALFTADAAKHQVTLWSLTTGLVTDSIPLAAAPQGLALSADGLQLWVTVPLLGQALVYDPQTLALLKTITLHGLPEGVGVGPTGTVALVANDSGWVDVVPR